MASSIRSRLRAKLQKKLTHKFAEVVIFVMIGLLTLQFTRKERMTKSVGAAYI